MSQFALFMKKNKIERKNAFYAATKSLVDESGKPLMWELRPITSRQAELIREECMKRVPDPDNPKQYTLDLNSRRYVAKLICASVVVPNLNNKELQDSYGVANPEDLLLELVDDPMEYNKLAKFVQHNSGITSLNEDIETAKN